MAPNFWGCLLCSQQRKKKLSEHSKGIKIGGEIILQNLKRPSRGIIITKMNSRGGYQFFPSHGPPNPFISFAPGAPRPQPFHPFQSPTPYPFGFPPMPQGVFLFQPNFHLTTVLISIYRFSFVVAQQTLLIHYYMHYSHYSSILQRSLTNHKTTTKKINIYQCNI